jgi:hypothetical protein
MRIARDVGAKMIHMPNLIIVSVKAHMAKPCDAATKTLNIFQSSFRWRLMRIARDVGAKTIKAIKLIVAPVNNHVEKIQVVSMSKKVEFLS